MSGRGRASIPLARALSRWPVVRRVSSTIAHLVGSPSFHTIGIHSELLTTSAKEAVQAVLGEAGDHQEEFKAVAQRMSAATVDPNYPDYYGVENETAYLLYALVRERKPELAVEMGVADGRSTQVILSAMDANGNGRLVSIDIKDDVGGAAAGHPRWDLRVQSPEQPAPRRLAELFAEIGSPDLFFHDAMHTYYDQYAEYLAALDHMRPGSVFVSDDIDHSFAFLDLVAGRGVRPVVLNDRRKAVGAFLLK